MSAVATGALSLRSRVLRGVAWKAVSRAVLESSRLVVAVVLARLLAPHDYGLAGMVIVFSSLVLVFSDVALGAALVQRRKLTEADRSTVFWTSVGIGTGFTLLGIALAGPIAAFYGEPAVKPLFMALSLGFLVTSLGTTQSALLTRELDFRALELRLLAGTLCGAVVGIGAAASGAGAWAIILQQLTIGIVSTTLLWLVSPWRPRFTFSLSSLRELGGFSGNVFVQRLLYYAHRNADKLLIGRFLGPVALGPYALAYNVILLPFSRIAGPIQEVLFPAFSRMQDDRAQIASVWIRATRLVASFSVPALAGLVLLAPEFVDVVLGERWRSAVPVIRILAFVGLVQSLQTLNGDILQALDRTRTLVRYSCVFFAGHLVAFSVGLEWGIVGVAAAYAVSTAVIEPLYAWLTARALGISVVDVARGLAGVAQAAALMLLWIVAMRALLLDAGVPAAPRLVLLVAAGAAVYLPCLAWRAPELRSELRRLRPSGA